MWKCVKSNCLLNVVLKIYRYYCEIGCRNNDATCVVLSIRVALSVSYSLGLFAYSTFGGRDSVGEQHLINYPAALIQYWLQHNMPELLAILDERNYPSHGEMDDLRWSTQEKQNQQIWSNCLATWTQDSCFGVQWERLSSKVFKKAYDSVRREVLYNILI
jgi:hypothetical protein